MSRLILPQTFTAALARRRGGGGGGGGSQPGTVPAGTAYSILNPMLAATGGSAEIYHVTNLNTSGPGSLKDAIENRNAGVTRLVVFDVSGHIPQGLSLLFSNQPNLYIAGETAPDPGDGTGRGICLEGRIRVRRGNFAIRHVHFFPFDGTLTQDRNYEAITIQQYDTDPPWNQGDTESRFWIQNCSVRGTADEAIAITSSDRGSAGCKINHFGVVDCFLNSALNWALNDPNASFADGHSYGPMQGMATGNGLWQRNLITSAVRRSPQLGGQYSDSRTCNNYIFNYGRHREGSDFSAIPFILDLSSETWSNVPNLPANNKNQSSHWSNYVEGGSRSNPWQRNGQIYYDRGGNTEIWRDGNDYHVTYFAQAGLSTGSAAWLVSANNTDLRGTIQGEWIGNVGLTTATALGSPHRSAPLTVLSAADARQAVLTHSGAWPAQRNAFDQIHMVDEVTAKTHNARRQEPSSTDISTRTGAPPAVPSNPWNVEANGLTAVENWLHQLHWHEAGGYFDYAWKEFEIAAT